MQDNLYNVLYQIADTVIEIKEFDPEEKHRIEVFELSKKNMEKFFEKVNEKLDSCNDEEEVVFVKESTLNFLIFSLKKLIVDYDCTDENIEYLANHIRDQLLSVKRSNFESKDEE
jgi:vacuolar-type H+-ATPase subunit E/Vma4